MRLELVNGFCHGDDFVTAAAEDQIERFGKLLQDNFDTIRIGMIGAAEHLDKELEVLHRSVRVINNDLMENEADQKRMLSKCWKIWDSFKATLSRLRE